MDNKNCSASNIKKMKMFIRKTTLYKNLQLKKLKNTLIVQLLIELPHQNNRTLIVGANFARKSYLMLKILSRLSDRDTDIITKSPPEQYSNSKIKSKEMREEIKHLNEYENSVTITDDVLGSSKAKNRSIFHKRTT